ncbi:hypothetical protein BKA67DRAFT_538778 [Truncatella angustata]|uniref:DUF8035 domain-containing protein n=1 Tax=Truncatella angustata TaxID=152316 RepID=A0A9P8UF03_9PEZI|nr:uncharacterized protein BKA67DRAFT_538778 [Truncatella angustata]KAH6648765.1 hypothetical protein BKA67DRAFT_538778 [Truncatella angustata]KAH8201182.1 hypothetical protein TruAng_004650 [Truncatella angustata]
MSYRVGGGRASDVDDRSYYRDEPRRGPPRREYDDVTEVYERREERRSPPRRAPVREYEETDISIRERESRTPAFLREEPRRGEAGPLVLRSREIETIDRRRPRSPSPVRAEERIMIRRRSISPPPRRERERDPLPAPMPEIRRPRFIERSPSPGPEVRVDTRIIERRRERSPTPPPEREREIRIIDRERRRVPSPSPSPPPAPPTPQPQVIRGPTIEREVITHYRDIDHGVERAPRPPSPPPPPRRERPREREREIDIGIYDSRGETEVDIHQRTRSRSRPRARPVPPPRGPSYYDDEVIVRSDRDRLKIDIEHDHRRSRSVAPPAPSRPDYSDEAEYITSKIDSRGQMGEAWHGATKDWTIVDVPPGTERVKMDGVGGGGAEVTWQRYNGVRRAKFLPERDGTVVSSSSTSLAPEPARESVSDRDRLSVQIYDKHRDSSRDRTVVEDVHDTRISIRDRDRERRPVKKQQEMWTEITKDLVVREAVERMGYEYEETEFFFYVMEYLRYEDVLQLVNMSDSIRKARKERAREIEWEREARERWERRHRHPRHRDHFDDERIVEHEVIYERDRKGSRQYLH